MTTKPNVHLIPRFEVSGKPTYAARNEELRRENTRLKTLVVKLSAIIAKNAAAQK